jgi:hypothetical protein
MRNRHLASDKKGFIGDSMTLIVYGLILALTIMIGFMVLSAWNTKVQATPSMGSTAQTLTQTQTTKYPSLFDGIFGFIFIGASLAAAVSAYFVDTHPILFFLVIVVLAVIIIVAGVLSNAYSSIETSTGFADVWPSFQLMHYLMNHLALYALVEGALITIALFTKARQ